MFLSTLVTLDSGLRTGVIVFSNVLAFARPSVAVEVRVAATAFGDD
jgi:hypothetical protein